MRVANPDNTVEQQLHILRLLRKHGAQTRRQLSEQTGYSVSLVRQLTQGLVEHGLMVEGGLTKINTPGRPSQVWSLAPDASCAVGLDVGGIHTRIVVLNTLGEVLHRQIIPTEPASSPSDMLTKLVLLVEATLNALGKQAERVRGVGVAFSGFINRRGDSLAAPNIAAIETEILPLQTHLAKALNLPVIVEDSSRTMALAEMRYGAARGYDNFIGVNIGAGIGTGIVIDGNLYVGELGLAGELGHIPVMPTGDRCRCGKLGCLETVASGNALAQRAGSRLNAGVQSQLRDLCDNDPSRLTAAMVTQAALAGDQIAQEILADAGMWVGMALGTLVNLFSPKLVVLTGGVMRGNTLLFGIIRQAAYQHMLTQIRADVSLVLTELDEQVGALGAATLILDAEFEQGFAERLNGTK